MTADLPSDFDAMFAAYCECAVWASSDPEPLDSLGYTADDIGESSAAAMYAELLDFVSANAADLDGLDAGQIGHDFWLSRNGHGTGFWDRGYGQRGDRLHKAAKAYGESCLMVGDDGELFVS